MNMILHNITRFTIENGDTLEDPLILENGQVRKFDRVLANPPFSQNYSRANMKFPTRFREWCPETGKKAEPNVCSAHAGKPQAKGPHGHYHAPRRAFRGGKEKLIRKSLLTMM